MDNNLNVTDVNSTWFLRLEAQPGRGFDGQKRILMGDYSVYLLPCGSIGIIKGIRPLALLHDGKKYKFTFTVNSTMHASLVKLPFVTSQTDGVFFIPLEFVSVAENSVLSNTVCLKFNYNPSADFIDCFKGPFCNTPYSLLIREFVQIFNHAELHELARICSPLKLKKFQKRFIALTSDAHCKLLRHMFFSLLENTLKAGFSEICCFFRALLLLLKCYNPAHLCPNGKLALLNHLDWRATLYLLAGHNNVWSLAVNELVNLINCVSADTLTNTINSVSTILHTDSDAFNAWTICWVFHVDKNYTSLFDLFCMSDDHQQWKYEVEHANQILHIRYDSANAVTNVNDWSVSNKLV